MSGGKMGVVDSFMGASVLLKVALCLDFSANFFSWIAFTTTGWAVRGITASGFTNIGIWRACPPGIQDCFVLDGVAEEWYGAFQAFSVLGFVMLTVSLLLMVLFIFGPTCKQNSEAGLAAAILAIAAAVCWFIAVIIFAAEYPDIDATAESSDFDYSFALAIIAFIVGAIAGVLAIVSMKTGNGPTAPQA